MLRIFDANRKTMRAMTLHFLNRVFLIDYLNLCRLLNAEDMIIEEKSEKD